MAGTANTMIRRSRASARALPAIVVLGVALSGLAAAAACLPDLAAFPAEDAAAEAAAPLRGCGDGIIAALSDGGDAGESCDPGPDASAAGCTACQITCEGSLDPKSGHCYFALSGSDNDYSVAASRCFTARAHVVTVASPAEEALVEKAFAGDYWVGLARSFEGYLPERPEEPGFPLPGGGPCDGCFGVGADAGAFPALDVNDPDPACIASHGGAWFRVPCNKATAGRRTICEREPVGVRSLDDCIIGGVCFSVAQTAATKTYVVVASSTDPDQAAQICAGLDGGSLAVFESAEEREQLAHEVLARFPAQQQLWIGLSVDGGKWIWEDGVVADRDAGSLRPLPWGNAQPASASGPRAYMRLAPTFYDTQLAYADDGTRTPRIFVCQRPAR